MRWFKHFSDNYRGRTVQTLLDGMGPDGVGIYYILMEMCAEKIERHGTSEILESDIRFTFHRRTLELCMRCKWLRIEKCMTSVAHAGLLRFTKDREEIHIEMPILLDLLDRDLKGARSRRAQDAQKPRLEKREERRELDSELDKESESDLFQKSPVASVKPDPEKQKKASLSLAEKADNLKIKSAYVEAYRRRWKVDPKTDNAKFNSMVSTFRKNFGADEAIRMVEFYLTHNDSWFVKNTHAFQYLVSNADTIRTQMLNGRAILPTQLREFERATGFRDQLENLGDI